MAKEFIPIFLDFNDSTQDLTDEQCGRLIRALVNYANGLDYHLQGVELIAFRFLKGYVDRNEVLSKIRAEAGSKGGKQTAANRSKGQQTAATGSKIANDNNNCFDIDCDSDSVSPKQVKPKRAGAVFIPPSIEEVAAYCRERGNAIDAEAFVTYYQACGWELGNGRRIKDWKAKVRSWELNKKEARNGELRGSRPGDRVRGQRDEYEN